MTIPFAEAHRLIVAHLPLWDNSAILIYRVEGTHSLGGDLYNIELELDLDAEDEGIRVYCASVSMMNTPTRTDEVLLEARQIVSAALGGRPVTLIWTEADHDEDMAFSLEIGEAVDPRQMELALSA